MKQVLLVTIIILLKVNLFYGQKRKLPIDTTITTQHSVTINGTLINYTAQTGTQPVWDDNGKATASLHYTYYTRNNIKDGASRPLLISFNGGPGSGSVWMHLAYTGPRRRRLSGSAIRSKGESVFCARCNRYCLRESCKYWI